MLTAHKLTKSFAGVDAVRNVSLTLEPGRIMALVGASGSGKSTLLSMLAGLTDADAGEVRLNGERVPGPLEVLVPGHTAIRLVPQDYQLMPNVSVRDNIAHSLRYFEKSYREFRVGELLKRCHLTGVQHRIPRRISGGEKQRTAIARAIADKPTDGRTAVLLLDEPFSHLDLPNRLIVRDLLFDLVRHDQMACLFVTHDATDALSMADTLGILCDGKLIQLGTPTTVYRQPATAYAARMTGLVNVLKERQLTVLGLLTDQTSNALYCLRPEQILLDDAGIKATIRAIFFKGSHSEIDVQVSRFLHLSLLTTRTDLEIGQEVGILLMKDAVWCFGDNGK